MEKSKKLQIVTSLAIINTFASPIWGNINSDLQNKPQLIALVSLDLYWLNQSIMCGSS